MGPRGLAGSGSPVVGGDQGVVALGDTPVQPLAAYTAFFAHEYRSIVHTVYLILPDRGLAEELAQEAFIQLLRHWPKVSRYQRPGAWVRRVAIRLATRQARREQIRSRLERANLDAPTTTESHPEVQDALKVLPAVQRAAIVLFYFEDLPVDEISEILDCSPNTVKSHLHRGRAVLRTLLGEPDDVESGHGA